MNKLLGTLALLVAIAMPAFAQQAGRLSPDDQREFDKYYTKWVNDTRKNDRDDIAKDVKHMQELMGRNGVPSNDDLIFCGCFPHDSSGSLAGIFLVRS